MDETRPGPSRPRTRAKLAWKLLTPVLIGAGAALALYGVTNGSSSSTDRESLAARRPAASRPAPVTAPPAAAPLPHTLPVPVREASLAAPIQIIVARNDTLDRIFRRMSLDIGDLAAIRNLPGIRQSLDFLKPGEAIEVTHEDGAIRTLMRKVSETRTLQVVRDDKGFAAKMIDNPVEVRTRTATAYIDSSLFQAAETAGISEPVALALTNVFAWDIDFAFDLRDGDTFTVVYEQVYRDGKYLRDGAVLAAEFVNAGKVHRALRYTGIDGQVGYYAPDGLPMRKAFLRAPVEFTRISSGFNPHRYHPILNLIRGHMGTDYAAPIGTPVHAASDGRIAFEGRRGGYGNAIMIDHSRGVSTLYGHMSRFARNIGIGTHVHQGEIIGYVGMTGLATGPHLHYEFLVGGVHQDPEKVKLPSSEPLDAAVFQRFKTQSASLLARLDAPDPVENTANHHTRLASN